ncbi:MAG: MopE-related protein [archaeon]
MKQLLIPLVVILLLGSIAAADIAYLTKSQNLIDQNVVDAIEELDYTIEYIDDSDIGSTDFSEYKMILVPNQGFGTHAGEIPVNRYNTLIINRNHLEEWYWSGGVSQRGSNHPLTAEVIDKTTSITNDIPDKFQVYTQAEDNGVSIPIYYLSKYEIAIDLDVIVSEDNPLDGLIVKADPGTKLKNSQISKARGVFFGITETEFWTPESKTLFQNSVVWLVGDVDQDQDGYKYDDCNDNNPSINPGADEIPYDGIDQDCDGKDLRDVDKDGYNAKIVGGNDCDDNDPSVNPGSSNPLKDCSIKNPEKLDEINKCENFNNKIGIKIKDPDDKDDFMIGDKISIKVEIENKFDEELDFDIDAHLYDLNEKESIEDVDDSIDIKSGKDETLELELEIPDDLEEGDYLVYIYAEAEDDLGCNFDYVEIGVEREEHKVVIDKIEAQEQVSPGDILNLDVRINNQGASDEDFYILIENSKLDISEKSEEIEIEEYGEDDSETISFSIDIPEDAEDGNYEFSILIVYDDGEDKGKFSITIKKEPAPIIKAFTAGLISLGFKSEDVIKLSGGDNILGAELIKVEKIKPEVLEPKIAESRATISRNTKIIIVDVILILGILVIGSLLIVYRKKIQVSVYDTLHRKEGKKVNFEEAPLKLKTD